MAVSPEPQKLRFTLAPTPPRNAGKQAVSKFSRGAYAWKEHRIADRVTLHEADYTVQLVARRGTGFQGYRVTLHFIPHAAGDEVQAELPNAASTADVHRVVKELTDDPSRVQQLFEEAGANK